MLSFTHPLFLLGLAGLAVPVVLHLMNREIAVLLRFPSIRFIRVARLPQAGRRRLRDLLLLAFRLLLLAAAILALAGPRWQPRGAPAAGRGPAPEVILVADLSASMAGWHGIENLKRLAADELRRWHASPVGLVACARRPLVSLPPARDHQAVQQALAQLTPEPVRGEPLAGLREAMTRFTGAGPRRLIILSDFQQTDWQNPNLQLAAAGTEVELVDVNPRREGNSGLLSARATWLATGSVRVTATIRNFGSAEVAQTVSLKAGTQATSRDVTIPPLENREVTFVIKPSESVQGELVLGADAYPGDNHYFFWLGRPAPVTLLAVTALDTEPMKQQDLFFLQRALETTTETSAIQYRLENVETDYFSLLNLGETPGLFLVGGLAQLSSDDWGAIRRYLDAGGWVFCLPGDGVLNLFQETRKTGILAADFLGLAGADPRRDVPFGVDWINPEGTLGRLAAEAIGSDLYLFQIFRYMRLRPPPDAVSLLKTASGDPLLLERAVGKGRFFLFTFSFSLGSSDLAMTSAFLPLIRELVSGAVPADYGMVRVECGQDATLDRPELAGAPGQRGSRTSRQPLDTALPGVQVIDGIPVEVNLSRRESVVEKIDTDELSLRLTGKNDATADRLTAGAAMTDRGRDLRPALGLAVAGLFLLEMVLAMLLESREFRRRNGAAPAVG